MIVQRMIGSLLTEISGPGSLAELLRLRCVCVCVCTSGQPQEESLQLLDPDLKV